MNILLIEDDKSDVALMETALQQFGGETRLQVCEDGEVATRYLHSKASVLPDIIVLDINLPKKNGHYVLRDIKSNPRWQKIPVLVFSTTHQVRDIEMISAYADTTFVSKPSQFGEYKKVINSIEKICEAHPH